jgi:hypothetical protein
MTSGQITYDLRRPGAHGLIVRNPHTHRYQVTDSGLRHALFLTACRPASFPGSPNLPASHPPPVPAPLRAADRAYRDAIHALAHRAGLAA